MQRRVARGLQRLLRERYVEFVSYADLQTMLRERNRLFRVADHLLRDVALQTAFDSHEPRLREYANERLTRRGEVGFSRQIRFFSSTFAVSNAAPDIHFPDGGQQCAGRAGEVAAEFAAALAERIDRRQQPPAGRLHVCGRLLDTRGRHMQIGVVLKRVANELVEPRIAECPEPRFEHDARRGIALPTVRYGDARQTLLPDLVARRCILQRAATRRQRQCNGADDPGHSDAYCTHQCSFSTR